jgi:hypothetical protein
MNALDLHTEATPRSQATIDACTTVVSKKARKFAKQLGRIFVVLAAVIGGVVAAVGLASDPPTDIGKAIGGGLAIVFELGLLPAWGLRWLIMRDVKLTKRLARDGVAYRARIVRREVVGARIPQMIVSWREEDRDRAATLQLTATTDQADPEKIVVLSSRHDKLIVAAFADQDVCVARKITYRKSFAEPARLSNRKARSLIRVSLAVGILLGGVLACASGAGVASFALYVLTLLATGVWVMLSRRARNRAATSRPSPAP